MRVKSAVDKLTRKKRHPVRKEDIAKFQDLSQCASQQNNVWEDLDDASLTPNKERDLTYGMNTNWYVT